MDYPSELKYTRDHEWARSEGDVVVVGITEYAQHELGEVVYVELPQVGDSFKAGEPFGSVESVKAVSEIYAPLSGEVVEANSTLEDSPELINEDPHNAGWLAKFRLTNPQDLDGLMDAASYQSYLSSQK